MAVRIRYTPPCHCEEPAPAGDAAIPKVATAPPRNHAGRQPKRLLAALLVLTLCSPAFAAKDEITINMVVNYGSAYRDGAWTPIDVFVDNQQRDVEGWVELRTFGPAGDVQNPIYRVYADSPKNSKKRFRFHCLLQDTARIEAQLLHGRRAFIDVPTFLNVTPIRKEDFLCLVLDDKPENFGFLSTALFTGAGDVRFYRESLDTSRLAYLADYAQCYDALDLVVMGEVDPARIGLEHRDLLKRFVERGGVLVVCAGANAKYYRGSWVEEFAGVALGQEMLYKENELARRVFDEQKVATTDEERQALVTRLETVAKGLKKVGEDPVLATLRPYGSGCVAVVAVDAASGVLQRSAGYASVWRDLIARSGRPPQLNYSQAATLCANQLPIVAGVELLPVRSVIIYLVVYFVVAIVGNWLFWNYFKRREYAWLCLVGFSIAFTGYAMIFGTAGRAKVSEIEQIEVLCVPEPREPASDLAAEPLEANLHAFAGLLAAGSGRYGGALADGECLVSGRMNDRLYGGMRGYAAPGMFDSRPFVFVQDRPARVEEFQVGASEMRILQVDRRVEVPGGVSGTLTLKEGMLVGDLENNTGFKIRDAWVLCDGAMYRSKLNGNGWSFEGHRGQPLQPGQMANYYPPTYHGTQRFRSFQDLFDKQLFGVHDPMAMGGFVCNPSLPPCLVGWVSGKEPFGSFTPDEQVQTNISGILVVAQIDVEQDSAAGGPAIADLAVRVPGTEGMSQWRTPNWTPNSSPQVLRQAPPGLLQVGQRAQVSVRPNSRGPKPAAIRLELMYPANENAAVELVSQTYGRVAPGATGKDQKLYIELRNPGAPNSPAWTPANSYIVHNNGFPLRYDTYLLEDFEAAFPRNDNTLADMVLTVEVENAVESPFETSTTSRTANPSAFGPSTKNTVFVVRASALIDDNEKGVALWR